jgi:dolichol-phosphate mannosyltransferase
MTGFLSFCLVGASGVVVDMGVLALLVTCTPLPLLLAKAVACEVAIASNFLGNDRWTFRGTGGGPGRGHRFLRFNGVALAGLVLNVTAFAVLVHGWGISLYPANALAIGLVAGFNYLLSRHWVWKTPAGQPKAAP